MYSKLVMMLAEHSERFHFVFIISTFYATGLFPYPVKTSENYRFSVAFRRHRKGPVVGIALTLNAANMLI